MNDDFFVCVKECVAAYFGAGPQDANLDCDLVGSVKLDRFPRREFTGDETECKRIVIPAGELLEEMKRAYHYYEKSKGKMELFSESRRYECALEYGSRRRPSRSVLLSAESCDLMRDSTRYSIGCCSLTYSLFILFKYCSYRRGFQSSGQNWSPRAFRISRTLRYGESGYLDDISGDWKELLPKLMGTSSLRVDFGKRGYKFSQAQAEATALEFKYMYSTGTAVRRLIEDKDYFFSYRGGEIKKRGEIPQTPPRKTFDRGAVDFYRLALTVDNPYLEYISYYHVLEFYFNRAYKKGTATLLRNELVSIDFSLEEDRLFEIVKKLDKASRGRQEAGYGSERSELTFLLDEHVDIEDLIKDLESYRTNWVQYYESSGVCFEPSAPCIRWGHSEVLNDIVLRVYKVRNAIIHSKQQNGAGYSPFSHDAALSKEIPLIRALAERVIDGNGNVVEGM